MELAAAINQAIARDRRESCFRARIQSLSGNLAYIVRDSQVNRDPVPYPTNADVTFGAGDEVLVFAVGGSYVVGFRIAR